MKGIFIGGCHRSGTSFLTKCFYICGADLGKRVLDSSTEPDPLRLRVLNEDPFFIPLNERILQVNGGSWDRPPIQISYDFTPTELMTLVSEKNFSHEPYVLKDPRLSILYPLYYDLYPDNKFVICFRNPKDVIISLNRRGNNDIDYSYLWICYNSFLLKLYDKFGDKMKFIHFPSLKGLEKAIEFCNLKFKKNEINREFDSNNIHSNEQEVPMFCKSIYQKLTDIVED